jgi:hypothetical protein
LTVAFRQSYSDGRPKSFMLPGDLEEKRYQLRQNTNIQRSLSTNKLTPVRRKPISRPTSKEEIENKWSKLMENDDLLRRSIKGTSEERDALRQIIVKFLFKFSIFRAACEITREVVEELEKRARIM